MNGLLLGIDLCDDYSQVCCLNPLTGGVQALKLTEEESSCLIPTAICKKKTEDVWFVGEEAYRRALLNEGVMVDKLVRMAGKEGTATIEGVKYTAEDMLSRFVSMLLEMAARTFDNQQVDCLAFSLQQITPQMPDLLVRVAERCHLPRESVRVFCHSECFVYYVLSQPREIWANTVSMFDLMDDGLNYYEMHMIRGRRPPVVEAVHEKLEDGFSLGLLDNASGEHMADTILTACAQRMLEKKVVSSVYLTGKGFVDTSWAPEFLQKVCYKRKVFAGQHVFASGAAYLAGDAERKETAYPYVCLGEGRVPVSVSLQVLYEGRNEKLMLVEAGTNWVDARSSVELIPDGTNILELNLAWAGTPQTRKVRIDFSGFPQRPNKTTRMEVIISFTAENQMTVRLIDRGFGELFPASGKIIREDIAL